MVLISRNSSRNFSRNASRKTFCLTTMTLAGVLPHTLMCRDSWLTTTMLWPVRGLFREGPGGCSVNAY